MGPEEELVAGRRPVEEAFVARRSALRLLVVPQRRQALERLVLHATSLRIPIVEVEGGTLTSVAGFDGHQGIALVVRPRAWATLEDVLARADQRGEPPFILVMDSLEDPQNVGTLLRSAEAVGAHGVLFPTHRQAPLSPAAIKASAGATEHLLLVPVDDLPGALADLHIRGIRVVGADEDAPLTGRQADLRGPVALVVGSEGHGIGPAVRRRTDLLIRIPMRGAIGSLNAAVAGSVLLFEILEQRGEAPTEPRPKSPERLPDVERAADAEPAAELEPAAAIQPAAAIEPGPETNASPDAADVPGATAVADEVPERPKRRRATAATRSGTMPPVEGAASPPGPVEPLDLGAVAEPAASAEPAAAAEPGPAGEPAVAAAEPQSPVTRPKARRGTATKAATGPDALAQSAPKPARKRRSAGASIGADDLLPGGPMPSPDPPERA